MKEVNPVPCTFRHSAFFASIFFLTFAAGLSAANSLPAGTVLPVRLNATLSSAKSAPGQTITARIMQNVPLPDGSTIRAGAKVIGHVVGVAPASNRGLASITVQFDTLETRGQKVPITTGLRAIASFVAVEQAQIPDTGPDRGTSEDAFTTDQIGGETVYRGGGHVEGAGGIVGEPVDGGVLSRLDANPDGGCRGAINSNDSPQALWVFSSDACGAYSLPNLTIRHAGRSNPAGQITLESKRGNVEVKSGAGMLLRVNASYVSGA